LIRVCAVSYREDQLALGDCPCRCRLIATESATTLMPASANFALARWNARAGPASRDITHPDRSERPRTIPARTENPDGAAPDRCYLERREKLAVLQAADRSSSESGLGGQLEHAVGQLDCQLQLAQPAATRRHRSAARRGLHGARVEPRSRRDGWRRCRSHRCRNRLTRPRLLLPRSRDLEPAERPRGS
jgi:hypothetical protein